MKKLLLISAALALTAFASPSMAANGDGSDDGPYATYNWGGFYAGVNGGYGWGDQRFDTGVVSGSHDANGWSAGGTLGFNIDSGDWIFGVEGDYAWTDFRGSTGCAVATNCSSKMDQLGTFRVRVGYDVASLLGTNPLLVYATGGLAVGQAEFKVAGAGGEASDSKTVTGGTYGAGLEYSLGNNMSVKAEYLRVDIGDDSYDVGGTAVRGDIRPIDYARAGINFRF